MARFPVIQSPCPYKDNLAAIMEGDVCRMCQRQVHDITAMTDGERDAFLAACSGEVCVKYEFRMPRRVAAAALGVAVAAMPLPLAAQEATAVHADAEMYEDIEIMVGGLTHLDKVEHIEDRADKKRPELPVVYEDELPGSAGSPTG